MAASARASQGATKAYVTARPGPRACSTASTSCLRRGETTSLMGTSGSGKSTLIALLAGLMRPDSGSITFDGLDLSKLDDTERASCGPNGSAS